MVGFVAGYEGTRGHWFPRRYTQHAHRDKLRGGTPIEVQLCGTPSSFWPPTLPFLDVAGFFSQIIIVALSSLAFLYVVVEPSESHQPVSSVLGSREATIHSSFLLVYFNNTGGPLHRIIVDRTLALRLSQVLHMFVDPRGL